MAKKEPTILHVGRAPPVVCGIAHYTANLVEALQEISYRTQKVVAMNGTTKHETDYPFYVVGQLTKIREEDAKDPKKRTKERKQYEDLGDYVLKSDDIKAVSLQFENGIFGGVFGSDVLYFLERVKNGNRRVPIVTTIHTVLPEDVWEENGHRRRDLTQRVLHNSDVAVVLSHAAKEILKEEYQVKSHDIRVIHHGVHPIYKTQDQSRRIVGLPQEQLLFGVVGIVRRARGIENSVNALPYILEKLPEAQFLIAGATHGDETIKNASGKKISEPYREELMELAYKLNVEKSILDINRTLEVDKMANVINALDFNITSYLERDAKHQVSSGMLSQAMSSGTPTISSPFPYAREILADGRGILVPYDNPEAIAEAIIKTYSNPEKMVTISQKAKKFSKHMLWPNVARKYRHVFDRLI